MLIRNPFWRRLGRSRAGVALTEFAVAAPVMAVLFMGGVETWRYVQAHRVIDRASMTVADVTGQSDFTITEENVNSILSSAAYLASDFDLDTNGRVILSVVQMDEDGAEVLWQRCRGTLSVESTVGTQTWLSKRKNKGQGQGQAKKNTEEEEETEEILLVAEVYMNYQPLLGMVDAGRLDSIATIQGRLRTPQTVTSVKGVPASTC